MLLLKWYAYVRLRLQTKSLFSPSSSARPSRVWTWRCAAVSKGCEGHRREERGRGRRRVSFVRSACVCLSICPSQATFPLADLTNDGGKERDGDRLSILRRPCHRRRRSVIRSTFWRRGRGATQDLIQISRQNRSTITYRLTNWALDC